MLKDVQSFHVIAFNRILLRYGVIRTVGTGTRIGQVMLVVSTCGWKRDLFSLYLYTRFNFLQICLMSSQICLMTSLFWYWYYISRSLSLCIRIRRYLVIRYRVPSSVVISSASPIKALHR